MLHGVRQGRIILGMNNTQKTTKEILEAMGFIQDNESNPEEFHHDGWEYFVKVGTPLASLFERLMALAISFGAEQKENQIKKALGIK